MMDDETDRSFTDHLRRLLEKIPKARWRGKSCFVFCSRMRGASTLGERIELIFTNARGIGVRFVYRSRQATP
jgi:hypothetical protein